MTESVTTVAGASALLSYYLSISGNQPQSLTVGDFNSDGKADLVMVSTSDGTVDVLIGNGDGTFQSPVIYTVGGAQAVAVGDINGDGKPDLAVASSSGTLSILLGNGNGTFQAPAPAALTNPQQALCVADFNGDGKTDVAVVTNQNAVAVLLGKGDGTFQLEVDAATGSSPQALAAGDFNGDGVADLAVANATGNSVSILLGRGDGTFRTKVDYPAFTGPRTITVGDFRGTGTQDVAVGGPNGFLGVLLGNGNGTFQNGTTYALGGLYPVSGITTGDMNGDGILDLITITGDGWVRTLPGNGNGTFQLSSASYSETCTSYSGITFAAGDFNGDGKTDVALAASCSDGVHNSLYVNLGATANLSATVSHTGNFTAGQTNATYTISVSNKIGGVTAEGMVTVYEYLPAGLSMVSMTGQGWNCYSQSNYCQRSDMLSAGWSYPEITVTVNVGAAATSPQVNSVSVVGGQSPPTHATDSTIVIPVALFSVAVPHIGTVTQGQPGITYSVTITNPSLVTIAGIVVFNVQTSWLDIQSMSGTGWNCSYTRVACTRADSLPPGSSYPAITVIVSVGGGATGQASFTATASGGGAVSTSASDVVTVIPQLNCALMNSTVALVLRLSGTAEAVGDIVVVCQGGSVLPLGSSIPTADITVSLPGPVTSRLLPVSGVPNLSEALLLIDEPNNGAAGSQFGYGPSLPKIVCSSPLNGAGPGGCTQYVGTAVTGREGYSPMPGAPVAGSPGSTTPGANVFQGIVSGQTVTFHGVPVLPPVTNGITRVYRITNIRVNANAIGLGAAGVPKSVDSTISVNPVSALSISNPSSIVGYTEADGVPTASTPPSLSQCTPQTKAPVNLLTFPETFGTEFKTRMDPRYPPQDVPGGAYNSESDLVVSGMAGSQTAGLADFGTRLKATFHNIPTGVRLFVSTANVIDTATPRGSSTITNAQLTATETGAYSAVAATDSAGSVPIVELTVTNGSATAVWEIISTDPTRLATVHFAVYATTTSASGPGNATVNLTLAPNPSAGTIPAFIDTSSALNLLSSSACNTPILSITKSHSGNFTQGQTGATYTVIVNNVGSGPTNAPVTVTETVPSGMTLASMNGPLWDCSALPTCTTSVALNAGSSYPPITVTVNVKSNATSPQSNSVSVSGGGSASAYANDATTILLSQAITFGAPANQLLGAAPFTISATSSSGLAVSLTSQTTLVCTVSGTTVTVLSVGTCTIQATQSGNATYGPAASVTQSFLVTQGTLTGTALAFVPITPCRVSDTRNPAGPFGGPNLTGGSTRNIPIPSGACGIPSTAQAYSLNAAIVPTGSGWITLWGAGQPQPLAASVNSPDGRVKSNGAIVPAGSGGAISVYASVTTDVVLDVNGYFVPASTNPTALAFYPVTPCRVADTRNANGSLGGPYLSGGGTRTFPVLAATACNIPSSAQAFSLNLAVVPLSATLGWLTAWPTGQSQPYVASLNDPPGVILSNGAVVPAPSDQSGQINIYATQDTHVIVDINGYFAPPGTGGLYLYAVQPCRVLDTRYPSGSSPYTGTLAVDVVDSGCGAPSTAKDYIFNATVVPYASSHGYMTMWPQGLSMPLAANLNTSDGAITGNMALVPTSSGWINAYFSGTTYLILDLFGYFAP